MVKLIRTDLDFILQQILYAEQHAAGADLRSLFPNPEVPFGLRTIDGAGNNLVPGQSEFGSADNLFPHMLPPVFRPAEGGTHYNSPGFVLDSTPRTISNLIVDQTPNNPAAVAANGGAPVVTSPGLDGVFGTADDRDVFFIPNIAPDEGLSASFNSWMTFFGQFFDHGLDLVTKGGNSSIFIPLNPDDPLYVEGSPTNFMVLTRATQFGGPGQNLNTTSPFVDQNQTYSSHPSHQVFLRAYTLGADGARATGELIENRQLGVDGKFGTADDVVTGGMATWGVLKAQARDVLGINLTDQDVFNVPLLATDQYGNFVRGPNGFPQVVMNDGLGGTILVEGNPNAPISLANAVRTGHAFLDDIAHFATPTGDHDGNPGTPNQALTPDADGVAGGAPPALGTYDNELLDAHYVAGDGRVNENIGLTAVHTIFHAEHNRLVEHVKAQVLADGDLAFLTQWLMPGTAPATFPTTPAQLAALNWNGERLFQAAKVGTEMQYQHLVFEEFARTIQPNVDVFLDFNDTINPAIMAEFAHTVYRFGHSMLTETIDRLDANFENDEIGLIAAFLNPLAFADSGATSEEATAAIIRGVTRQVGNEIDEFVTEALRNNLVGLPLDLAAINIARGRDVGIPSLNEARRQFFAGTGDSQLTPYFSWVDFAQHMKNPASLINFIAAYGTHAALTAADVNTLEEKRAVALALVLGGSAIINAGTAQERTFTADENDRLDFLNSQGIYANLANGVTTTGLDLVDFWIGGLAEQKMPFGGMLGSTFNFVFETQLEALQDGDRLYYLHRLNGLNFLAELEANSFSDIIMRNTGLKHLPALVFSTPGLTLEVDILQQFNANVVNNPGLDGILGDDPNTLVDESADDIATPRQDPLGESALLTPLVIRNNPATPGPDTNYLRYTGDEHVVLGGTDGNDILISSIGDDTIYGDGGNDRLEGGHGNDDIQGGAGDDIITDVGGDDVIKGGDGNDVIHGGQGLNLIIAGRGNDFIVTGEDVSEVFAGEGNDFILGSKLNIQMMGGEGDDWFEIGTQDGAPGDNFDPFGNDEILGNDVFLGDGGFDEVIGEGGDDIAVGSGGPDKFKGMSGFDWVTYKDDRFGVNVEMLGDAFNEAPVPASSAAVMNRFRGIEGLSGSRFADVLRGDDADAAAIATEGAQGSTLTNFALINGLQALVDSFLGVGQTSFNAGNIMLGGAGGDWLEGRGGDDLIDGDSWLNVRISVRTNINGTGAEIMTVNSMTDLIPFMLSGQINPGQLTIVREIIDDNNGFDTAIYSGAAIEYIIDDLGGGRFRVTDTVAGRDGVDTLRNVERLRFTDDTIVLVDGLNAEPVGVPVIIDSNGGAIAVGDVLRVSMAGVTDADGITQPVAFYWQVETVPGTGIFTDVLDGEGLLPLATSTLTVGPDLDGLSIRVRAVYADGHQVIESVTSAATAPVAPGAPEPPAGPLPDLTVSAGDSSGIRYIRADLQYIIDQISIAEQNAAGTPISELIPNVRNPLGLRTVTGENNHLLPGDQQQGAADNLFPRMLDPEFRAGQSGTTYNSAGGVLDSTPRTISNLIVDQTANNQAAVEANGGAPSVVSPGLDGIFGTADDRDVFFIGNTSPDEGLSAGFNSWMTFFGQFFDHGLDLVTKGGNSSIFIPLNPDDPLYVPGSPTNFMVLTRATQFGGPGQNQNTTSPFVDQNQTYSSHPSHQVFLRAYELGPDGARATGSLIVNRDLGTDGIFGTSDDTVIGGMATWAVVKAQARDILGIDLTDQDVFGVPLLATDDYGNFIRGPNGFPMVVMNDGLGGTTLVEGDPNNPISLANAVRTGHAFLEDIAHFANPVGDHDGNPGTPNQFLVADTDTVAGGAPPPLGQYDDELLDAHYIAGDGRVNENIGLTTVHHIFHAEHNRLVEHTKQVALATGDLQFLSQLLMPGTAPATFPATPAEVAALNWNGERLFQAAKFGTEMQYQHLVFEEFARTIQPNIDIFVGPTQAFDVNIDPSIVAEFAHTVYRFGHSMLTETIDRYDPTFTNNDEIGLIAAFLNPLEFAASGLTPDEAAGAIVRGVTRQLGNEIDEFVTEALRNNLVGLPLDLAAINIARGRDTGIPSLNSARRSFYDQTGDVNLRPYSSWADFVGYMKNPASLINFIAAYGTHAQLLAADVNTLAEKRAVAFALVFGGSATINAGTAQERVFTANEADRLDFLTSQGIYTNLANGATTTGVDLIDLWIGGLAEMKTPFGGMLGSTFNFVFETQLEALQNSDRFYYLDRLAGLNLISEMEGNSFVKMVMNHTDAKHLPGLIFQTPAYTLEVDATQQFTGLGVDGRADPTNGDPLLPLVIRNNPATPGTDTNYLQYTGGDHVVLGGTNGNDILLSGIGDDTIWGDGGNDRIDGGHGNDLIRAGGGDDIITDLGGDDNIQGDDGNDVIQGGNGLNLILGGFGKDFIVTGEDSNESFGGVGDDFILGSIADEQNMGGEGNDWIESGSSDGSPGDNFDPNGTDIVPGHDVYIGDATPNIMNAEGGDDIMVGSTGPDDKYLGASGFDWATFKDDALGVTIDLRLRAFDVTPLPPSAANVLARFEGVEGLSGSKKSDILIGDDEDAASLPGVGAQGSVLTNTNLIDGLQTLLNQAAGGPVTSFAGGNIILGGDGSDLITGNGGDDIIDGDSWLNVRISVRQNLDGTGPEIATFDSMRPMVPLMLNGTYNPGQLVIVREIKAGTAPGVDTAVYSDVLANYLINGQVFTPGGPIPTPDANGFYTIAHVVGGVPGPDGTDRVKNIEILRFSDQAVALVPGVNSPPVGFVSIAGTVAEDSLLTASIASVTDADNPGGIITPPVVYTWQFEARPGTGVFEDIEVIVGGEATVQRGQTFRPGDDFVGLRLRVKAVYQDAHGVLEQVFSQPTVAVGNVNDAPVGVVTISDLSPTEGLPITAGIGFTDPDGTTTSLFAFQWQRSTNGGATWTNVPGIAGQNQIYVPVAADALNILRVIVSYTDDNGTNETVISAPTGNVGRFFNGNNAGNTFNGTAFDDWMLGNGGNDTLTGGAGSDLLEGGAANDVINGDNGADTLNGDAGNDTLNGGADNDIMNGGDGNDTMNGGAGDDTMTGGAGNDTYIVDEAGDVVVETLAGAAGGTDTVQTSRNSLSLAANVENLTFTGVGNFTGTGNAIANVIAGAGGADTLFGLAGDDTLNGNVGDDTLDGGADNDTLNGGNGADTLIGGDGIDNLVGGNDNDTLRGGLGNDTLNGGGGTDTASYIDEVVSMLVDLQAGTSRRGINIAPVEDTLVSVENVVGGSGADTLTGSTGANVLSGGQGADTINGGAGNDTLNGDDGADVLSGNAGTDTVNGGAGNDTILYTIGDGTDTIDGGADTDSLVISGTGGNDTLDIIYNGAIATFENGSAVNVETWVTDLLGGTDTLTYAGSASAVTVNLGAATASGFTAIAGIENVTGGNGADTLIGDSGANSLNGGNGDDTLTGGLGNDTLTGGAGIDTASYANETTAMFVSLAANTARRGSAAAAVEDTLATIENVTGGSGNDTLTGSGAANTLNGGAGADTIDGAGGADVIIGGIGNDTLTGGGAADTFVFSAGFGSDTITDFDANPAGGQDFLDIRSYGLTALTFAANVSIVDLGADTRVTIGADTFLLVGVNGNGANVITQADFILV